MEKRALRKLYKEKRLALTTEVIEDLSLQIANNALRAPIWENNVYHLFLPITRQKEVDTGFLLTILQGKDKEVAISKTDFNDGSMTHYLLTDSTAIKTNAYGIPEPQSGIKLQPAQIDVIFIPLLAYDLNGHRVGYGKGFYDRFLSLCRKDALKVGLSFFGPEKIISDIDTNDIPLDMCITPEEVFNFRKEILP